MITFKRRNLLLSVFFTYTWSTLSWSQLDLVLIFRLEKRWLKILHTSWAEKTITFTWQFHLATFKSRVWCSQLKQQKGSHVCACSNIIKIFSTLILTALLRCLSFAKFQGERLIHFGQSSLVGHHLGAAGLFLVRGGIFIRHYCCLRFCDWMAGRFKKMRSDVMSCGMLS